MKEGRYVLSQEDYPFGFKKIGFFDSFDDAYDECCRLYDKGEDSDDFIISEGDNSGAWRIPAHRLRTEECPRCGKKIRVFDMFLTHDCQGIPFRYVCNDCYEETLEKGYDGEYYTEEDEQIEDDY